MMTPTVASGWWQTGQVSCISEMGGEHRLSTGVCKSWLGVCPILTYWVVSNPNLSIYVKDYLKSNDIEFICHHIQMKELQ